MKRKILCEFYHSSGTLIRVVQGDLTQELVEAIVNAANERLAHGGGLAGPPLRSPAVRSHCRRPSPNTVTFRDVDRFVIAQTERGLRPSTVNRRLAAITSFYTFLSDEDPDLVCPVLPHRHLPRPAPASAPAGAVSKKASFASGASAAIFEAAQWFSAYFEANKGLENSAGI